MTSQDPIPDQTAPLSETQEASSVGASALWGTFAKLASVITNFLIGVILARALGAEGKGTYALIQQMVGILCVVFGLGLSTSNVYFIANRKVSAKHATANTFLLTALTTVLATIALFLFLAGPFAPSSHSYSVATVILASMLYLSTTLYTWLGAVSIGLDGLRTQSKSSLIAVTLTCLLVFICWRSGSLTVTTMLLIGIFAQASGSLLVLAMDYKPMFSLRPDLAALKTMIPYSWKSYLVNLVGYLHLRQDVLILGWLAPLSSVGIYSIAVGFAEMLRYVPSILNAALFARISRPDDAYDVQVSALLSRTMVVFVLLSGAAFALLAPAFIPFVYGTAFEQSVWLFMLLLPGTVCISLSEASGAYLFSREVIYWKLSTVAVVLNIALNLILIPLLGVSGAAIASSVTYTLFSVGITRLMFKHTELTFGDLFVPKRGDMGILRDAFIRIIRRGKNPSSVAE